jgi:hypothetical protein
MRTDGHTDPGRWPRVSETERILARRQQALQGLRREGQPRIKEQFDLAEQEISAVLRADQRTKWQSRFRELRARWLPPVFPAILPPESPR